MSEDIREEPVSPLSAEPPRDRPRTSEGGFGPAPPFPRLVWAVGVIWIVAGCLRFLLALPLLYVTAPAFPYLLQGGAILRIEPYILLFPTLSILAVLTGAIFFSVGIRIVRGTKAGRAAGVIWIVAGCLHFLLVPPLLRDATPAFLYVVSPARTLFDVTILFVTATVSIPAILTGATFLSVGIRLVRGAKAGGLVGGLGVASLVSGILLLVLSGVAWVVFGDYLFVAARMFAVVGVTASLLLLTAGVLALAGRSQYELWRKAQEFSRERGGGNTDNPFRK